MLYYLSRVTVPYLGLTHKHMIVIECSAPQSGRQECYINPVDVAKAAIDSKNEWGYKFTHMIVESPDHILILDTKLDSKIIKWAGGEYKTIPKCSECYKPIETINTFCSNECEEQSLKPEPMDDNEETECFF